MDINHPLFNEAFSSLLNREDLSVKTAIGLAKINASIEKERTIYDKIRVDLIKKLGVEVKNEKGEHLHFTIEGASEENIKSWNDKFNELLETEFVVEGVDKIKLLDDVKIKPIAVWVLRNLLENY